jgi:DNA-directed RNA polymerase specialized sigma24 family protein
MTPSTIERDVTELYAQHADRVRRIILAGLRPADQHVADDIAQDVWVAFWQTRLRGTPVTSPAGLLATMARRRVYDHYRLARVRREITCEMEAFAGVAA